MNEQKSLLLEIAEVIDHRLRQRTPRDESVSPPQHHPHWLRWLGRQMMPNIGTLLMVVVLLLTVPSLAAPLMSPSATSTSTISFQGRLADSDGNPLTGFHTMEFRIYDVPTGGVPLWEEFWTGANSVSVSDGLFNVMLGSINNTLAESIVGHDELYLGITVDTDSEMEPRVQLGSVPFSMQAMTVPDGSITQNKIASDAITTTHIMDGAITTSKLASDVDWAPFGGREHSYPYLTGISRFGTNQGNICSGYAPGENVPGQGVCGPIPNLINELFQPGIFTPSANGSINSANNSSSAKWGYAYAFFLQNPGTERTVDLTLGSYNDVIIYRFEGTISGSDLGSTATLVYHRTPGNQDGGEGCPPGDLQPSITVPSGNFRLVFVTRGSDCTSYLNIPGGWIADNGLEVDWDGLRTYLGEY